MLSVGRPLFIIFNMSLKFLPLNVCSKQLSMTKLHSLSDNVDVPVIGCIINKLTV